MLLFNADGMNLYPNREDDPTAPLAPAAWTMTLDNDAVDGNVYHFAWVCRDGVQVCKLALVGRSISSEDEARRALATKARWWIDDYLSRHHSGDSGFDGSVELPAQSLGHRGASGK